MRWMRWQNATSRSAWKIEELQRFTRITTAGLAELADAGVIVIEEVAARRDPLAGRRYPRTQPLSLTAEQSTALEAILASAESGGATFLLHGITGSGKTEVYLQALAATIARGKRGIVLVPEIALTPQAMARFAGRFPGRVALLHSGLSDAERLDEWRRIRAGEVDVVLGSRSALFAPVERLGLIVVDEEHERRLQGGAARPPIMRAMSPSRLGALTGATVVLGSATPSVGVLLACAVRASIRCSNCASARPLASASPRRAADRAAATPGHAGRSARRAALGQHQHSQRAAAGGAAARRSNAASRRFSSSTGAAWRAVSSAASVAMSARCRHCDVSLTYHASERAAASATIAADARRAARLPRLPQREHPLLRHRHRARRDAPSNANSRRRGCCAGTATPPRRARRTSELLRAFAERRADVLVGTQMIAKGLDLPGGDAGGGRSPPISRSSCPTFAPPSAPSNC